MSIFEHFDVKKSYEIYFSKCLARLRKKQATVSAESWNIYIVRKLKLPRNAIIDLKPRIGLHICRKTTKN